MADDFSQNVLFSCCVFVFLYCCIFLCFCASVFLCVFCVFVFLYFYVFVFCVFLYLWSLMKWLMTSHWVELGSATCQLTSHRMYSFLVVFLYFCTVVSFCVFVLLYFCVFFVFLCFCISMFLYFVYFYICGV